MSTDRQQSTIEPSNLAVLRTRIAANSLRLMIQVRSWILVNRALSLAALTIVLLTVPVVAKVVYEHRKAEGNRPTSAKMSNLLLEALSAVEKNEFETASEILSRVNVAYVDKEQQTLLEFVQGAVAADDAEGYVGADRNPRFRIAVEHFKKSRELGFPLNFEATATFNLGRCLYHAGELTESRAFLEEAIAVTPGRSTEIHGMLAEAYRWGSSPDFQKSLEHNMTYIADQRLSGDEFQKAVLRSAELHWKLGNVDECLQAIEKLPADSPWAANGSILRARILLHGAVEVKSNLPDNPGESDVKRLETAFLKTLDVLKSAQQDPLNNQVIGEAMYLMGVCHLQLNKPEAALEQFRRTSRIYENTPEGLAAGVEQADLLRSLGQHDLAVAAYVKAFANAGESMIGESGNPWITVEQFRTRALDAFHYYLRRGEFQRATRLVEQIAPLVPVARAAEMAAELRRDWARHVLASAEGASEPETAELRQRGRRMLRESGLLFRNAAKLNFSERQYTENVWQSAECYRNGNNFTAAASMYGEYMKYEAKQRRSAALVGLGECQLSLRRPEEALDILKQCYEMMPNDIASYSARLLASRAYLQLSKAEDAELLLRENIGGNLLTPESKEWRESIFALGKLLTQNDRYEEAIRVLSEAVARYPESRPSIEARYLIAEEFRIAAKVPLEKARTDSIETARVAHLKQVQQFLTAAIAHYEETQKILNRRQEVDELTELERAILRNSYFAAGMSLVELNRFEDAIRVYSTTTNRYQHTPEVLEAFVQISGCYRRLNRPLEARGTVRQAKVVLNRLPENAPYTQATNMTRSQWVELLDWLITL
jgi:tetratricopeptide (TPR) repeat protein